MKFTGLDVLDSSIQRTNIWLRELMQELNWSDYRKTYVAFRCVLHALRDHLSIEDAIYVGEQMPMLVRGFYFEHWETSGKPLPLRNRNEFFSVVANYMANVLDDTSSAEAVTRAVFRHLNRKATEGEIQDLQPVMPAGLLDLWPPSLRAA
jgi:uncharacterized protein (DUF2267 family)